MTSSPISQETSKSTSEWCREAALPEVLVSVLSKVAFNDLIQNHDLLSSLCQSAHIDSAIATQAEKALQLERATIQSERSWPLSNDDSQTQGSNTDTATLNADDTTDTNTTSENTSLKSVAALEATLKLLRRSLDAAEKISTRIDINTPRVPATDQLQPFSSTDVTSPSLSSSSCSEAFSPTATSPSSNPSSSSPKQTGLSASTTSVSSSVSELENSKAGVATAHRDTADVGVGTGPATSSYAYNDAQTTIASMAAEILENASVQTITSDPLTIMTSNIGVDRRCWCKRAWSDAQTWWVKGQRDPSCITRQRRQREDWHMRF